MHLLEQLANMYSAERDIPLYHTVINTDIEVQLDISGRFIGAELFRRKDIVPVTEKSLARTKSPVPHPLCDSLIYTAGDLSACIATNKCFCEANSLYLQRLAAWSASEYSTSELRVLYRYLSKKTLISDILEAKLNINRDHPEKLVTRFAVGGKQLCGDDETQQAHIAYMRSILRKDKICFVTGEPASTAALHPSHIVSPSSTAKLITGNELPIGCETSFKAHTVLKRLISECGKRLGSKIFIAWDETGMPIKLFEHRAADAVRGKLTVLVLNELNRGHIAVSFTAQLDNRCLAEISLDKLKRSKYGHNEDVILSNMAERMLRNIYRKETLQSKIVP